MKSKIVNISTAQKAILVFLVLLLSIGPLFALSGCKSSEPEKIDVIGLPLSAACNKLQGAGWETQVVDDTPNSMYTPGQYESGDDTYNDCIVVDTEFGKNDAPRGYVSSPLCKVHIETRDQIRLI